jgi:transcriptional regulator with XRE-family HTH domain
VLKDTVSGTEIGKLLSKIREKSGLSQIEVAERIGFSKKFGQGYISRLEKGKAKNPPIQTILLYLRACGESWPEFFKQLDIIDFKMRHEKMIAQVHPPPAQRKIQRDAMRYEINIEFPSKEKEEIDFTRLKKQIKNKVIVLLTRQQIEENKINTYQKFAFEFFDFLAELNKPGMKMVVEKYQRAGLARHLIFKIKKIVFSVIGAELKRIEAKKPLPTDKQEKMAIGFSKYRIRIEKLETEVHGLLCDLAVPTSWFASYKAFTRECYRVLKKYYGKTTSEKLNEMLNKIVARWQKEGLKEDVLHKLREKIISVFISLQLKGNGLIKIQQ